MTDVQLMHAYTLISTLHKAPSGQALIEITGLRQRQRPVKLYFPNAKVAAETAIDLSNQQMNVFVSANPRNACTGFEQDVPFVSAIPLDLQPERTDINRVAGVLAAGGIPPTVVAVSGYGAHFYLTVEPEERAKAKLVAERIVKYVGSDPIHNSNRIMRCPGTLNHKKNPPVWCYLTEVHPERHYTIDQVTVALDRLGAALVQQPKEGVRMPSETPVDWWELRKVLSPGVLDVIDTGEKNAYSERQVTRSEADWYVVCALVLAGAEDTLIQWIYDNQPIGDMKYRDAGQRYLDNTIRSARRNTAEAVEHVPRKTISLRRPTGSAADRFIKR